MSELIQHNLKDFNKLLEKVARKNTDVASKVILMITQDFLNALIKTAPVDTGNLKGNWRKEEITKLLWQIINNTQYAPYVYYANKSINKGIIERTLDPLIKKARERLFNDMKTLLERGLR